jgi:cell wall-associated NlpC family hydrolase
MTADEIIAAARAELGTPFMHQGRIPGRGVDCIGLSIVVARNWYQIDEPEAYGRLPLNGLLQAGFDAHPLLVRVSEPEAGCILLMRFGKNPQHIAICAGKTIIHSYEQVGRVVEHNLDDKWRQRIVRAYKFRDMA